MRKLFTLFMVSLLATASFAQNSFHHSQQKYFRDPNGRQAPVHRHINNSSRATASVCDTADQLDYNTYNEAMATLNSLNFNGSWNSSSPQILAQAITSFVDTAHEFDFRYVEGVWDSIAFADLSGNTLYYPRASSTIYLDSLGMFIGIFGDTVASHGKMANDSLVFSVFSITGNTVSATPVKTVVFSGYAGLAPFLRGPNFLGYAQIGIGYQFTKGQAFAIRMDYLNKDTSSQCILSYTYADSCGTITFQGSSFSSPAYPSPFVVNSYWGEIQQVGTTANATVSNENNGYAYNIPGVPSTCTYVYTQNWELLPIINVCVDYGATITATPAKGCPGATITLDAYSFGTSSSNVDYTWSTDNGTITSANGETTTLVMGTTGNSTVILAANDGTNTVYDTVVVTNNGINIAIVNAAPIGLSCSGSAVTITTTLVGSSSTAGKIYTWSTNVTGANASTIGVTTPGTYKVTVTNNSGCSATASINAVYSNSVVNNVNFTNPALPLCATHNLTFVNTSSNVTGWDATWNLDVSGSSGAVATTTDATYAYPLPGVYTVKLTMDSAGCSFTSPNHTITVNASTFGPCVTGIEDITFSSNVSLLPNPSNGNVNIVVTGVEKNISIKVYNIIGEEVQSYTANDVPSNFNKNMNLSSLANGTYLVKIQTADKIAVKRLTINK